MEEKITGILPSFFMNSVPKSGTHLLKNILQGMPSVTHDPKNEFYEGYSYQLKDHFYKLGQMKPNEFGVGHVYYSPEWLHLLKRLNMKQIFLSRDPRDVVVSLVYFILEKYPNHPLYEYLSKEAKDQKQRYMALINGIKIGKMNYPSISDSFKQYTGWLNDPNTLSITFEDLIQSIELSRLTLVKITDYLWNGFTPPIPLDQMVERMEERMHHKYSLTFRSGKIGSWKLEFDDEIKTAFKKVAGNLLIELGYEEDQEW